MVGKNDTSDRAVLEKLVSQVQLEEVCVPPSAGGQVTDRQLDLTDADNGELHRSSVSKVSLAVGSLSPLLGIGAALQRHERNAMPS